MGQIHNHIVNHDEYSQQEILDVEYFLAQGIVTEIAVVNQNVANILKDSLWNLYNFLQQNQNDIKNKQRFENIVAYVDLLEFDEEKITQLQEKFKEICHWNPLTHGTIRNTAFVNHIAKKHISK